MNSFVKRFFVVLLVVIMTLSLASCTPKIGNGSGTMKVAVIDSSEVGKYNNFQADLEASGIAYEKIELIDAAHAVGAYSAARYEFEKGSLEIYDFDMENNEYRETSYKRSIEKVKGEDTPIVIMGDAAVISEGFEDEDFLQSIILLVTRQWH